MAAAKKVQRLRTHFGDRRQDDVQNRANDAARVMGELPFLRGRLISVKLAAATAKVVHHNLGVPARCFPVSLNYDSAAGYVRIAESSQAGIDQTMSLSIIAEAACQIDLWFYPRASKLIDVTSGVGV